MIPFLAKDARVLGIDIVPGALTDLVGDISSQKTFSGFMKDDLRLSAVINLAAARFDFGAKPSDYYAVNVSAHKAFLGCLERFRIETFIHVSSVAAFDGRAIKYSENLSCDDAYRCTKYHQEILIKDWCDKRGVKLIVLHPSAIFSEEQRADTNIGKLQMLSRFIPFVPSVNVLKTLTFLPHFCKFVANGLAGALPAGSYLTVETPILSVTQMLVLLSGNRRKKIIKVPQLRKLLSAIANFLYVVGGFGKLDLKLTPNRVTKLFSDTSYENLEGLDINIHAYKESSSRRLETILLELGRGSA